MFDSNSWGSIITEAVQNDSVTFSLQLSIVRKEEGDNFRSFSFNNALKVDPLPSYELTVTDPPKNSQILLHIVRPSPIPY
jgi:hypothetical protein